jgi:hypothetical protein
MNTLVESEFFYHVCDLSWLASIWFEDGEWHISESCW